MDKIPPEDFDEVLAADEAEPWGERRADYRAVWQIAWQARFHWPECDLTMADFMADFLTFCETGNGFEVPERTPEESAAAVGVHAA